MGSIYLGGTFYQFTAAEVRARQACLEVHLDTAVEVLKPKHQDDYPPELGHDLACTLTMRDKYLVKRSDMVVLDLLDTQKPPRGTLIEIGWANMLDIPIMLIIEPESCHKSEMVDTLITWETPTYEGAAAIINSMLT